MPGNRLQSYDQSEAKKERDAIREVGTNAGLLPPWGHVATKLEKTYHPLPTEEHMARLAVGALKEAREQKEVWLEGRKAEVNFYHFILP